MSLVAKVKEALVAYQSKGFISFTEKGLDDVFMDGCLAKFSVVIAEPTLDVEVFHVLDLANSKQKVIIAGSVDSYPLFELVLDVNVNLLLLFKYHTASFPVSVSKDLVKIQYSPLYVLESVEIEVYKDAVVFQFRP